MTAGQYHRALRATARKEWLIADMTSRRTLEFSRPWMFQVLVEQVDDLVCLTQRDSEVRHGKQ